MMPDSKVLADEILDDARRKADRASKKAERRAKRILRDAQKKADQATAVALAAAEGRAGRQAASILATIEQDIRRDLLDQREAAIATILDAAMQRVASREGTDYPAALTTLAAEAVGAMATDAVVLHLAEADRAIATAEWLDALRQRVGRPVAIEVADEAAPIQGGLIVRSADGRLLYDNSFAARLVRLRPALRRQIAARVYAQAPGSKEGNS